MNVVTFVYKSQPIPEPPPAISITVDPPSIQVVPPQEPDFVHVPTFRKINEDSVYADVLSHSPKSPFGDHEGRATNTHETSHSVHNYLRNLYSSDGKKRCGFYVLDGKAVVLEEPGIRKSQVADFVPQSLRSYRFNLYLAGQMAWDELPLYVYDEWVAYVLGGMCNVQDVEAGRISGGWTDGVSGCLELSIYSVALSMAVKRHDPVYWESHPEFRLFTTWMLRRAQETYMMGHAMEEFKWEDQDRLLKLLLTSPDAEAMRQFIRENLDGVWLDTDISVLNHIQYHSPTRTGWIRRVRCFREKVD